MQRGGGTGRSRPAWWRVGRPCRRRRGAPRSAPLQPGDRIEFRSAGAGGWGDPLERPAWRVERDLRRRLVTRESAERDYGVVPGDAVATTALRERKRAERGELAPFDFGELPEGLTPPK